MGVYVDELRPADKCRAWPFDERCRLFADSEHELEGMATSLKLEPHWRRDERGSGGLLYYPLTGGKRAQAIRLGANAMASEMADALGKSVTKPTTEGLFGQGKTGRML